MEIVWQKSEYLNKELLPNQEEISKGKHKIIFWNDDINTFTNSRGPYSDYSFTGCLPKMTKEEAKKLLVKFLASNKLCFNEFLKIQNTVQ